MTEALDTELRRVSLDGGYEVLKGSNGFRIKNLDLPQKVYPDASALSFRTADEAAEIANLLSLAFQESTSRATTTLRIADILEYEIVGGKKGTCRIFRLSDGQKDGEPIKPKSPEELVEELKQFFGDQR